MVVGSADTSCLKTYTVSTENRQRNVSVPNSMKCPFNNTAWYYEHVNTMNLSKTSLALDPFTGEVGLIYTAVQNKSSQPMIVVTYLDTAQLGRELKLYADLAFDTGVNERKGLSSLWDGISIFLFTTDAPNYVVATSSSATQLLLEGSTIYDASTIPNPHISSAISTIMTYPLPGVYEEDDYFVASAPVEDEGLYIGMTLPHNYIYRYEKESLRDIIVATILMIFILGVYGCR